MAVKHPAPSATEVAFIIEGLRKLALQRDTLRKYAILAEDGESEEEYEGTSSEEYSADIAFIRETLKKYGDTKPLVLKSERKPKAKKDAKTKTKANAKVKATK
jgi:hypothetical protein